MKMTHFKIDIQLPLAYNPKKGQRVGGISTSNVPVMGSWINPKTKKRYNDKSIVLSVVIESGDIMTIINVPKIKELKDYKETLKVRFKQHEIFMIATRCTWI